MVLKQLSTGLPNYGLCFHGYKMITLHKNEVFN